MASRHDENPDLLERLGPALEERISRRRLLELGGSLSLAALVAACGGSASGSSPSGSASGPKRVLRLGHVNAPTNHSHMAALRFADSVKKKTNGSIEVQVFPSSQLGGNVQMIEAVRTGVQDMVLPSGAEISNTVKEWSIFDLPYLFSSIDQANKVLNGATGRKFLDMLPRFNMYGLSYIAATERNLMSRSKPLRTPDDVKSLKVRVLPSAGYIESFKALGANPTPLPYAQLYLALQQGTVDAADTSPDQAVQDKFAEVIKNFTLNKMNYIVNTLIISKTVMDSLTKEQQNAIREAAKDATATSVSEYKKAYDQALTQMRQAGVQVLETDLKPWFDATASAREKLAGTSPNGAANMKAILEAAK